MRIKIKNILLYICTLSVLVNQTCLASKYSSALFWCSIVGYIFMLLYGGKKFGFKISGKKDILFLVMLFLCNSLLSIVFNSILQNDVDILAQSSKIWISYVLYFLALMLNSVAVPVNENKELIRKLSQFLIRISFIPLFLGAFQAFFYESSIWFPFAYDGKLKWLGRYYTFFNNPNGHSAVLFILIGLCSYLKYTGSNNNKNKLTFVQVLCFVNMIMCASRGTLVGVIIAWVLIDYCRIRYCKSIRNQKNYLIKRSFSLMIIVIILYFGCNYLVRIVPAQIQNYLTQDTFCAPITVYAQDNPEYTETSSLVRDYYEHGSDVSNERFEKWVYALKTVCDSPLIGVGLYGSKFISCHNGFISALLAYGIVGLGTFLLIMIKILNMIFVKASKIKSNSGLEQHIIVSAIVVGIMAITLTNDLLIFTFEFPNIIFYFLAGIILCEEEEVSYEKK